MLSRTTAEQSRALGKTQRLQGKEAGEGAENKHASPLDRPDSGTELWVNLLMNFLTLNSRYFLSELRHQMDLDGDGYVNTFI